MFSIRRAEERGYFNHGWLETYHTFSFGDYYSPQHMGFGYLRVINEDWVAPAAGFPTHGHSDMEIVTYVLEGVLAHKDSLGNGSVIRHGEIQRMTAGSGILHSEYNASTSEKVHLLQIWIRPNVRGLPPSYEQCPIQLRENQLVLIAAPTGGKDAVLIHQAARIYAGLLKEQVKISHHFAENWNGFLQIARGEMQLQTGEILRAGDGMRIENEAEIHMLGLQETEFLLFELENN